MLHSALPAPAQDSASIPGSGSARPGAAFILPVSLPDRPGGAPARRRNGFLPAGKNSRRRGLFLY